MYARHFRLHRQPPVLKGLLRRTEKGAAIFLIPVFREQGRAKIESIHLQGNHRSEEPFQGSGLCRGPAIGLKRKRPSTLRRWYILHRQRPSESASFISTICRRSASTTLGAAPAGQYTYFSKWYYPALREIVTFLDFKEDYKLLARTLNRPSRRRKPKTRYAFFLNLA